MSSRQEKRDLVLTVGGVVLTIGIFAFLQYTTGFFIKLINWLGINGGDSLLDFVLVIIIFCFTIAAIMGICFFTYQLMLLPLYIKQQKKIAQQKSKALFEEGKKEEAVLRLKVPIDKWILFPAFYKTFIDEIDWLISILQSYSLDDSYLKDFRQRFMKNIDELDKKVISLKEQRKSAKTNEEFEKLKNELNSTINEEFEKWGEEIEKDFKSFVLMIGN